MEEELLTKLIAKYLDGTCSGEERRIVEEWYNEFDTFDIRFFQGDEQKTNQSAIRNLEAIREKIKTQSAIAPSVIPMQKYKHHWWRMVAAAILLFLITGTVFLLRSPNNKKQTIAEQRYKNDVQPGNDKAILTLANGRQIILDSAANGRVGTQGNTTVINMNGLLTYNGGNGKPTEALYNTITTPKGGKYQVLLSDGSKVWLNAASSLRFPASFVGNIRGVELKGEGYFEVAKNVAMPFKVDVNNMQVQVLGTHFNVMAYDDEQSINTTLLEGAVKITQNGSTVFLMPGEQARAKSSGPINIIPHADVDEAVAWKNEIFSFNDADIHAIMRQVARWYDVNIVYDGVITKTFVATISRDLPVSKLLHLLELTNQVHFKIDGKKITVMR